MSLFNTILSRLGFGTAAASPAPTGGAAATPPSAVPTAGVPAPTPVSLVDVTKKLEGLAAASPHKLNWKTSIADLLRLLEIDNSYAARKELATELGCPPDLMGDSARMNMWLHKTVLKKLAENGGNVPRELLD
jgi:Domain of unknown function (DUF3597)